MGKRFPFPTEERSGRELWPSKIFFDFWVENDALWYILVAIFADWSNPKLYWLLCFILVFPLPTEDESWEGAVPPPQKFFWLLSGKWHTLVHYGCYFCWCKLVLDDQKQVSIKNSLPFKISLHFSIGGDRPIFAHKFVPASYVRWENKVPLDCLLSQQHFCQIIKIRSSKPK